MLEWEIATFVSVQVTARFSARYNVTAARERPVRRRNRERLSFNIGRVLFSPQAGIARSAIEIHFGIKLLT